MGKFRRGLETFGEFGKFSMIHQTKTIQISTYNQKSIGWTINLLNFLSPNAWKESIHQTFPYQTFHYTVAMSA